jgi:hypothetical protein
MSLTFYEAQGHFGSFHFAMCHLGMPLTDAYGFINNIWYTPFHQPTLGYMMKLLDLKLWIEAYLVVGGKEYFYCGLKKWHLTKW